MNRLALASLVLCFASTVASPGALIAQAPASATNQTVPIAIISVQEKGDNVATLGGKISSLLYAELSQFPEIVLVEREELDALLKELRLNLSGIVDPATANRVGRITGARILISLSVLESDQTNYLVAKLMGTETSRVIGVSSKATKEEGLEPLVEQMAAAIQKTLETRSSDLLPKPLDVKDRIAAIAKQLGNSPKPSVAVNIPEQHVRRVIHDPAAQTELIYILKELGFTVYEKQSRAAQTADIQLTGTGTSEFATEREGLHSVRARLEVSAIHGKNKATIAVDRQTTIVVELSEQIASKTALQQAAGEIADRFIVKMVEEYNKAAKPKP